MSQHSDKRAFTHIRAAIYGEPWAILPSGLDLICSIAESHAGGELPETFARVAMEKPEKRSKLEIRNGVGVIPITGPIFPKANLMTELSGASSSAEIGAMIDECMSKKVSGIVLVIDSPGGSVFGGYELSDKLDATRRKGMPIVAAIEGYGASLAYMFASQADKILATKGSVVGSISTVMKFASDERAMKNAGIDPITITSGDMKQIESRFAAAGGGSLADIRAITDKVSQYHAMFVETVRRGRPRMAVESLATGETWLARQALEKGLIDAIGTVDDAVAMLA